jgi:hypothetical protein
MAGSASKCLVGILSASSNSKAHGASRCYVKFKRDILDMLNRAWFALEEVALVIKGGRYSKTRELQFSGCDEPPQHGHCL